ncbi:hypothetical protein JCM10207_008694 [Rhodosporidiobolus poonsookiae]
MTTRSSSAAPSATSTPSTSSASSISRPPVSRALSQGRTPVVGLSSLTTRSSSTSRAYNGAAAGHGGWVGATRRGGELAGGDVQRFKLARGESPVVVGGRRGSGDAAAGSDEARGRSRRVSKGKGKAVTVVVGLPSSGDEGDAEDEDVDLLPPGEHRDALEEGWGGGFDGGFVAREPSVEDIIRFQIRQPLRQVDAFDLDSLLPNGIADYTFTLHDPSDPPPPSRYLSVSPSPSLEAPIPMVDSPAPHPDRISLGKGKFSEVLLVRKGGTEYALKHTPLHSHHPLIATRLLREPNILAQLLPHRNLVKVFEQIRTPGHAYLVQENLRSSVTLEELVASSPGGVLPVEQAWSILEQLASVVRSLHEPLRVCHRDIKPENILIRVTPPPPSAPPNTPPSLLLKLLDFGLATHYSSSEPKLTTCCGSPAYHSPELWRSLREPSGSVRYWGPDVDVWCTGLTILRCLTPSKYPLGVSHTSLQAIADKVVDALLSIRDASIRQVLAGFLHLDGKKRMKAFERFCAGVEARAKERAGREATGLKAQEREEPTPREFKSTSFLPAPVAHRLQLYLDEQSCPLGEGPKLEASIDPAAAGDGWETALAVAESSRSRTGRSTSTQRTAAPDSPKLSPTTVVATGMPRPLDDSPDIPQGDEGSSSVTDTTPDLSPYPASLSLYPSSTDSLASLYSPIDPASDLLHPRKPTLPPPIELALLNPTNEGIRRAVSYIKYALRCSGVLYHVRSDPSSPARSSFASPVSAPPSLPQTPYMQTLPLSSTGAFPFPTSSLDDDDSATYLQCVVALSPSTSIASPSCASDALRSALHGGAVTSAARPKLGARASTHLGHAHSRSASTPARPDAGRKDQQKKEIVQALTFYLSIRKADSPLPASPFAPPPTRATDSGASTPTFPFPSSASTKPTRRARTRSRRASASPHPSTAHSSRILITLSDDRAIPFVRDALLLREGETAGASTDSAEDSSASNPRRGRARKGGSGVQAGNGTGGLTPRGADSGSRDARDRRQGRLAKTAAAAVRERERDGDGIRRSRSVGGAPAAVSGLGMEMGPPSSPDKDASDIDPDATPRPGTAAGRRQRTSSFWDFAGLVGRIVGGAGSSDSQPTSPMSSASSRASSRGGERERPGNEKVKRLVEAASGVL